MKCLSCGYTTFDYIDRCKKCGKPIEVKPMYKVIYPPVDPFIPSGYELVPEKSEQYEEEELLSFDLAGIGARAVAFVLDLLILFVVTNIVLGTGLFFADVDLSIITTSFMNMLISLYLILLFLGSTYFVFLQGFGGKTIGKMIFGLRVIRDDGGSIGLWEAFIRWLGYFISAFFVFIGFIWAIFDSKSQTWHDKFAGTYVIRE
jgi:uncharacterized RDD family membrane protein YckC